LFLIPDIEFVLEVTASVAMPFEVTVDTAEDPGTGDGATPTFQRAVLTFIGIVIASSV